METILKTYFQQKYLNQESLKPAGPKPIVTISREFGCPSKSIALLLTDHLNRLSHEPAEQKWKFINKEVVEEAAHKLDINSVDMNYLISSGQKGLIEDFLTSFSPVYASNRKIVKTLNDVIRTIADRGHIVFVGRGSVAILQGYQNTLHIRLQAPLEWRVRNIAESRGCNEVDALKLTKEIDRKRTALIELLYGKKLEHHLFDVIFSCPNFTKEEIVQSILKIMEVRKMI
jgi:cytidylate kinase